MNDFTFSNLIGTVYKKGNLCFSPDGNHLLSPVGNRITMFDLVNNSSFTLPFEARKNISKICLSSSGLYLIAVDEDGRAYFVNLRLKRIIYTMKFKSEVSAIEFSPCGKYFAVGLKHKNLLQIWNTPAVRSESEYSYEFRPFELIKTMSGHYDSITSIKWSQDSSLILTSSRDLSMRVFMMEPSDGFKPIQLCGHRDAVVSAWWSVDESKIFSVGRDGALFVWKKSEDPGAKFPYQISAKHYFNVKNGAQTAKVSSVEFHAKTHLLIVGFTHGVYGLWDVLDFQCLNTFSLSQCAINSVALSPSGEWFAFASAEIGQLIVWEWRSESYILKQQGHTYDMSCVAYSPDGETVVTGGDDGKIKIWNISTGFCSHTFSDHTGGVSAVQFSGKMGKHGVFFSASLDGTVRAYDLVRCKNFRVFTSPYPVNFTTLAVDSSGEIVCAGGSDSTEIFVWSVQTGKLLDVLTGHEGPISALTFSPDDGVMPDNSNTSSSILASGSWDKTVRLWNLFSRGTETKCTDTIIHDREILALSFRPDGKELCSATLSGKLMFWNPQTGEHSGRVKEIEGKKDIQVGRLLQSAITAKSIANSAHFTSISYSADGEYILACSNSKSVCMYELECGMLVKRFQTTTNFSLDGMKEKLNSKRFTEFGSLDLLDNDDSDVDSHSMHLPGVIKGEFSTQRPSIRNRCVRFSPTGRSWALVSVEGLLIYSLDSQLDFDPFDLDLELTPESIEKELMLCHKSSLHYIKPLIMALRLNENAITVKVYQQIPKSCIDLTLFEMPTIYVQRFCSFLSDVSASDMVIYWEQFIDAIYALFKHHGHYIKTNLKQVSMISIMRQLHKVINLKRTDLGKICNDNVNMTKYLQLISIEEKI